MSYSCLLRCLPLGLISLAWAQNPWSEQTLFPLLSMGSTVQVDVGDLDGDGDGDVLFGGLQTGAISWFENIDSNSTFVGHVVLLVSSPYLARLCDVDADGDLDVVASWNTGAADPVWLENDGQGGGWVAHPFARPNANDTLGTQAEFHDLDGDGYPEMLASTNDGSGLGYETLVLYRGTGTGFAFVQTLTTSSNTGRFGLGDLDGDGDLDVLSPSRDFATNPWFRNQSTPGNLSLVAVGSIPASQQPVPADMDGDGDLDVILVGGGSVDWSENQGSTAFGPAQGLLAPHPVPGSSFYYDAAARDLDGDGDGDFVVLMRPSNTNGVDTLTRIAAFENLGNGTLGPRTDLRSGNTDQARIGMGIGDLDRDGDLDVVGTRVATGSTGQILWHRNGREFGAPVSTVCSTTANSSGLPGRIALTGSDQVGQALTHLVASDLPTGVFGYFLVGTAAMPGIVPPGSSGPLCVGGSIGRFNALAQIFLTDTAGTMVLPVDLASVPSASGPGPILAGETRTFQAWHRDPAATTSNFTDAIEVTFQ